MKLRTVIIGVVVLLFILGAGLVFFVPHTKYEFYESLIASAEQDLEICNNSQPHRINLGTADQMAVAQALLDQPWARVRLLDEDGMTIAIKYYHYKKIIAGDLFADDGRIIRRDLYDTAARVRVMVFFSAGKPRYKHYVNTKGEVILARSLIFPMLPPLVGY